MRIVILALCIFSCCTKSGLAAEGGGKAGPFYTLIQCAFLEELSAKLDAQVFIAGDVGSLSKMRANLDTVRRCLDEKIVPAVEAAAGHADAQAAVKDYYVARKAKLDAMFPAAHESQRAYDARLAQLGAGVSEKMERAKLEWTLAKLPES